MSIDIVVGEVLRSEPEPPRRVRYLHVLSTVFRSSLGLAVFVAAVPCLISGAGLIASARGQAIPLVFAAGFVVFACLVLLIPFIRAGRVRGALGSGIRVDATVRSLARAEGPSRRTMDSMVNGFSTGVRRIHHPLGEFDERFRFDGPGAARLRVGSVMSVLVDPADRRVLLDVTGAAHGDAERQTRAGA